MANEARPRKGPWYSSRGTQVLIVVVVAAIVYMVVLASKPKAPTYFTSAAKVGSITSVVQA
ncbi:MAG: hypothetical protein ACRD2D_05095, partial [Terriglobales bacterium]